MVAITYDLKHVRLALDCQPYFVKLKALSFDCAVDQETISNDVKGIY